MVTERYKSTARGAGRGASMNPHSHLQKGAAPGGGAPAVVLTGTIASAPPTAAGARTFEDRDDGHAVAHILQPPS